MFIRFYDLAKSEGDDALTVFCRDVLGVYDKHGINTHIEWRK